MADRHIKSHPERDKEMKDKEDFASQNFNDKTTSLLLPDSEVYKKRVDEPEKKAVSKNWNVNFIEDKVFEKELEFLSYIPQGETVIVLAPKLKLPPASIKLDENTKRDLLHEELSKLLPGYRVVAMSPQVVAQVNKVAIDLGLETQEQWDELFYTLGSYVYSPAAPIRMMDFIEPLDTTLAYYEVFHREIRGFTTQEEVIKFKPVEDDVRDSETSN